MCFLECAMQIKCNENVLCCIIYRWCKILNALCTVCQEWNWNILIHSWQYKKCINRNKHLTRSYFIMPKFFNWHSLTQVQIHQSLPGSNLSKSTSAEWCNGARRCCSKQGQSWVLLVEWRAGNINNRKQRLHDQSSEGARNYGRVSQVVLVICQTWGLLVQYTMITRSTM